MAQALPRNPDVAAQFELLADLMEIGGEDAFRVVAYRRAATRIRETAGPVAQLALEGRAKELSGIGKTIEEKIVQIVERGEIDALAKRRAEIPDGVVEFMRGTGMGRALFADAEPALVDKAIAATCDALAPYATDEGIRISGTAWLVQARAGSSAP